MNYEYVTMCKVDHGSKQYILSSLLDLLCEIFNLMVEWMKFSVHKKLFNKINMSRLTIKLSGSHLYIYLIGIHPSIKWNSLYNSCSKTVNANLVRTH